MVQSKSLILPLRSKCFLIVDWIAKYEKMVEVWKKQAETADKVTAAIGKENYYFKISSQDGTCLKVSLSCVFLTPVALPLWAINRVRNVNKTKFWTLCTTCWSIYVLD